MPVLTRLVAPRVQVPLAISACFVTLAALVFQALHLATLSRGAVHAGLVTVALVSVPVVRRTFLGPMDRRTMYRLAMFLPPVVGALGSTVVRIALSLLRPEMDRLSIMGLELGATFWERFGPGALLGIALGPVGSLVLAAQLRLAIHARKRDEVGGAHRFACWAWLAATGLGTFALLLIDPRDWTPVVLLVAFATSQLAILAIAALRKRADLALFTGPYR